MIIDCDTHLMPRHAFDGVDGALGLRKPTLKFNNDGLYVDVEFPGYPPEVPGTSPLLAPGSGAMFKSLWDVEARMEDYDQKLGIEQHVILPQFSGWWSYLIEAELATRMARSHNEALLGLMKNTRDASWALRWLRCRMSPVRSVKWSGRGRMAFARLSWTKFFR